jgi:hypothetical protein
MTAKDGSKVSVVPRPTDAYRKITANFSSSMNTFPSPST